MKITLKQTILLVRQEDGSIGNILSIAAEGLPAGPCTVCLNDVQIYTGDTRGCIEVETVIPQPAKEETAVVRAAAGEVYTEQTFVLHPVKQWNVHLVHTSHHDPGYTDLMSHVMERHYTWIDQILDEMDKREEYPEDCRLRITIEQFWSLEYYLKKAPAHRVEKLIGHIRRGDIAVTAAYGNMITEQLGHEEAYRVLYDAAAFAQKYGIPVRCAMHNDIPGVSWGFCRTLCDAGIEFLHADFPRYYDWGYEGLLSFWDPEKVIGHSGPYLCRWTSPDGQQILLWDGGRHILSGWDPDTILQKLESAEAGGYPLDTIQFTVHYSNIDNSCYTPEYADQALLWNIQYVSPHIMTSTSELFLDALKESIAFYRYKVPEIRGEMPGQDYPVAAMSMAQITTTTRRTQAKAVLAEKLLALTEQDDMVQDQKTLIAEMWRDILLADDHAYGYQFPAGPAMRASYWEKGVLAMRAEANAHDLCDKALASIADRVDDGGTELRLIVFNPSGTGGPREVSAAFREFDNCGTILHPKNGDPRKWTGYLLNNRRRVNPSEQFWEEEKFALVDLSTGREIPYILDHLDWDDPEYYAPENYGLGSGTRRYGFFERPGGMKKILRFVAEDLPPFGYKMYALIPQDTPHISDTVQRPASIENEFYRISYTPQGIVSIVSLADGKELIDPDSPYLPGEILVRQGRNPEPEKMSVVRVEGYSHTFYHEVCIWAELHGLHDVQVKFSLWNGISTIHTDVRFLKSSEPLQSAFAAFPFIGSGFRYEGVLSEMEPGKDIMPGGQSDFLTCRDYVRISGSNICWSSLDTGVVAMGNLWKGYISPAHSCIMEKEHHTPLTETDFQSGNLFAMLFCNNFGTNFMCSQVYDGIYKFRFGTVNSLDDTAAAAWGEREQNPVLTQFTDRSRGKLPYADSMIDCGNAHCLALKKAADGNGYIIRLWNHSDQEQALHLCIHGARIREYTFCDALERNLDIPYDILPPKAVVTLRLPELPPRSV